MPNSFLAGWPLNLLLDWSLGLFLCVLKTKAWPVCFKTEQGYTEPGKWRLAPPCVFQSLIVPSKLSVPSLDPFMYYFPHCISF